MVLVARPFEYLRPASLKETVSLLDKYGEKAKILAGGQSLVPIMKLRLSSPNLVIDINGLKELSYITESSDGKLHIGALTKHAQVERSPLVRRKYPALAETASEIGDPLVRNRGTIGGSLAHADPSADYSTVVLALDASIRSFGPSGERSMPAKKFFKDMFETALAKNEILQEIVIPKPPPRSGSAFLKLKNITGDFAVVNVAVQISLNRDGRCSAAAIAAGAIGSIPVRASKAENLLRGKNPSKGLIEEISERAADGLNPPSDLRGSSEYRLAMVKVLTARAFATALKRAKGSE